MATTSAITTVLPLTTSSAIKGTTSEAKREMRAEFRQKVTKTCSQHLKQYVKENRINKVSFCKILASEYNGVLYLE